jgi:hypothetical protein
MTSLPPSSVRRNPGHCATLPLGFFAPLFVAAAGSFLVFVFAAFTAPEPLLPETLNVPWLL